MVAVVWQFDTRPEHAEAFERFYGADGEWTRLSRRSRSFLGSSFLKDLGTAPIAICWSSTGARCWSTSGI